MISNIHQGTESLLCESATAQEKKNSCKKQYAPFGESHLKFSFTGSGIVLYLLSNLYHH